MKKLTLLLVLFVFGIVSNASQTTATSNGDWSDPIWSNGEPGCIDSIYIPVGVTVTLTSTLNLEGCTDSIVIFIHGSLEFQTGKKLKLPCDSDVLLFDGAFMGVGGGGGSSTYLEICGSEYWNASLGNLTGPQKLCDGGCPGSQLPIELLSFTAEMTADERRVHLRWITSSEQDNDFFTVERSVDGINWVEILTQDGNGTSLEQITYEAYDEKPVFGISYYRLKQTDFNGDFTYSPIVSVNKVANGGIVLYPNPVQANNSVVFYLPESVDKDASLRIVSADGKVVGRLSLGLNGGSQYILNLPEEMTAGLYFIQIENLSVSLIVQ